MRRVGDSTRSNSQLNWIMATLLLGAAVASVLYFHVPLFPPIFNPDAPNFNPVFFVTVFLSVFGLKYAISALWDTLRGRRFGLSVMELDRETVALGETLTGVVRTAVDLEPLGDYEVSLKCVEQSGTEAQGTDLKDTLRSEQTLRVIAKTVNPREGIPFAFTIPPDAMSTRDPDVRIGGSVRWILEVKAPLSGLDFYAIFVVEVRPAPR